MKSFLSHYFPSEWLIQVKKLTGGGRRPWSAPVVCKMFHRLTFSLVCVLRCECHAEEGGGDSCVQAPSGNKTEWRALLHQDLHHCPHHGDRLPHWRGVWWGDGGWEKVQGNFIKQMSTQCTQEKSGFLLSINSSFWHPQIKSLHQSSKICPLSKFSPEDSHKHLNTSLWRT